MKILVLTVFLVSLGVFCMTAEALTSYDLTTLGAEATINGALFTQDGKPMGTGNLQPFVRIQVTGSGPEAGYNTEGATEFETKDDGGHNWTHSLSVSDLVPMGEYYVFVLDISERGSETDRWLSLDQLRIHLADVPDLDASDGYPAPGTDPGPGNFGAFGDPIYDLDWGEDSWIKMNYALYGGSGQGDLFACIPTSLFVGGDYVYLYSQLGAAGIVDGKNWQADDGFEEWAAVIPAPGAIMLGGIGVALVGWLRRRRTL